MLFFVVVGGVGLNFVGVNWLIFMDVFWNFVYD